MRRAIVRLHLSRLAIETLNPIISVPGIVTSTILVLKNGIRQP
jgi:hypothetical protein